MCESTENMEKAGSTHQIALLCSLELLLLFVLLLLLLLLLLLGTFRVPGKGPSADVLLQLVCTLVA